MVSNPYSARCVLDEEHHSNLPMFCHFRRAADNSRFYTVSFIRRNLNL